MAAFCCLSAFVFTLPSLALIFLISAFAFALAFAPPAFLALLSAFFSCAFNASCFSASCLFRFSFIVAFCWFSAFVFTFSRLALIFSILAFAFA